MADLAPRAVTAVRSLGPGIPDDTVRAAERGAADPVSLIALVDVLSSAPSIRSRW
jgi:hypothetical protein